MYLNDPSKRNGVCGTTEKRVRRSLNEVLAIFIPSTKMQPPESGLRRNNTFKMLDFPAPVLPTIPV